MPKSAMPGDSLIRVGSDELSAYEQEKREARLWGSSLSDYRKYSQVVAIDPGTGEFHLENGLVLSSEEFHRWNPGSARLPVPAFSGSPANGPVIA